MNLYRQATLNVTAVCDIVVSNEDVQFYWCIVLAQYQQKHETLLLKEIAMQWITVRGFAYTSGWIEQYKQIKKTALQKINSLEHYCRHLDTIMMIMNSRVLCLALD